MDDVEDSQRLTVDEAAQRLGVKRSTIYAYVSRGVLDRYRDPESGRSLFDRDTIDGLARRGRPRTSTRDPRVDLVVPTSLTTIPPGPARAGGHRYRGRSAVELADSATFEEVAGLLIDGTIGALRMPVVRSNSSSAPTSSPNFQVPDGLTTSALTAGETGVHHGALDPLRTLRAAVEHAATLDALSFDHGPGAARAAATPILDALVAALVGASPACAPLRLSNGRTEHSTIAGRLAHAFHRSNANARPGPATPSPAPPVQDRDWAPGPTPEWSVEALNAALVLLADHELAASTFTARVAASTRASPYACVVAALATLSGPLHGSASSIVRRAIDSDDPPTTLLDAAGDGPVPGFGHLLYETADPRCEAIVRRVRAAVPSHPAVAAHDRLCAEVGRRRRLPPNVDVGLATLSAAAGWAPHAMTFTFAVARSAGWLAHVAEEYGEAPLRFRARAVAVQQ